MHLALSRWPDELTEQELLCASNLDPLDYPTVTDRHAEVVQALASSGLRRKGVLP